MKRSSLLVLVAVIVACVAMGASLKSSAHACVPVRARWRGGARATNLPCHWSRNRLPCGPGQHAARRVCNVAQTSYVAWLRRPLCAWAHTIAALPTPRALVARALMGMLFFAAHVARAAPRVPHGTAAAASPDPLSVKKLPYCPYKGDCNHTAYASAYEFFGKCMGVSAWTPWCTVTVSDTTLRVAVAEQTCVQ